MIVMFNDFLNFVKGLQFVKESCDYALCSFDDFSSKALEIGMETMVDFKIEMMSGNIPLL